MKSQKFNTLACPGAPNPRARASSSAIDDVFGIAIAIVVDTRRAEFGIQEIFRMEGCAAIALARAPPSAREDA